MFRLVRKKKAITTTNKGKTSEVLFRLAERLFTVGVTVGVARIVMGSEVTILALGAMVVAAGLVSLLLMIAHFLNKKGE